jgi:hypothetical protein
MKKVLELNYSRVHPCAESDGNTIVLIAIEQVRTVFGSDILLTPYGKCPSKNEFCLTEIGGSVYYDGVFFSDISVLTEEEAVEIWGGKFEIQEYDPEKAIIKSESPLYHKKLSKAMGILQDIKVDGETMQFILEQLFNANESSYMDKLMHRQLIMSSPIENTKALLEEMLGLEGSASDNSEVKRLTKRLKFIEEDIIKLSKMTGDILSDEIMAKENEKGESIDRMIGNIEMAVDLKEKDVDVNWKFAK